MYINASIKEYLSDLAAKKPAPGGGSAASLSASIGVALISMVANYTIGNPKHSKYEHEIADLLLKAENFRQQLEGLIDEDVSAYNNLSRVLKECEKDSRELEDAYKRALRPPFETCRISDECIKLCEKLVKFGNKNLITDTAIAAIMLEGAFFSAKYNVYINMKYLRDTDYIGEIHKVLAPLEISIPKMKEDILELCEDVIAK